jgi:hypothetical protein
MGDCQRLGSLLKITQEALISGLLFPGLRYTFYKNVLGYILGDDPSGHPALEQCCQIFLGKNTKTGKIYQITLNYTKCP